MNNSNYQCYHQFHVNLWADGEYEDVIKHFHEGRLDVLSIFCVDLYMSFGDDAVEKIIKEFANREDLTFSAVEGEARNLFEFIDVNPSKDHPINYVAAQLRHRYKTITAAVTLLLLKETDYPVNLFLAGCLAGSLGGSSK